MKKIRLLLIDWTPMGGGSATGELKSSYFADWPIGFLNHFYAANPNRYGLFDGEESLLIDNEEEVFDKCVDFKPDVILYRPVAERSDFHNIANGLIAKMGVPYAVWMMDDWPDQIASKEFDKCRIAEGMLKRSLKGANACFAISDEMSNAFKERYGVNFTTLRNGVDLDSWEFDTVENTREQFIIRYAGSLAEHTTKESVERIAQAVESLSKTLPVKFEIKTQSWWLERESDHFSQYTATSLSSSDLDAEQYRRWLSEADILLIAYSFKPETYRYLKYSFANKIPECLASGAAVLVHGPRNLSSVSILVESGVVEYIESTNTSDIECSIENVLKDSAKREELGAKSRNYAFKYFNLAKQKNLMFDKLCELKNTQSSGSNDCSESKENDNNESTSSEKTVEIETEPVTFVSWSRSFTQRNVIIVAIFLAVIATGLVVDFVSTDFGLWGRSISLLVFAGLSLAYMVEYSKFLYRKTINVLSLKIDESEKRLDTARKKYDEKLETLRIEIIEDFNLFGSRFYRELEYIQELVTLRFSTVESNIRSISEKFDNFDKTIENFEGKLDKQIDSLKKLQIRIRDISCKLSDELDDIQKTTIPNLYLKVQSDYSELNSLVSKIDGRLDSTNESVEILDTRLRREIDESVEKMHSTIKEIEDSLKRAYDQIFDAIENDLNKNSEKLRGFVIETSKSLRKESESTFRGLKKVIDQNAESTKSLDNAISEANQTIENISRELASSYESAKASIEENKSQSVSKFNSLSVKTESNRQEIQKINSMWVYSSSSNSPASKAHKRHLSNVNIEKLISYWGYKFNLELSKRSLAYLAHKICVVEDSCSGRIATEISTAVLRVIALLSLQKKNIEILEVGTLFGIGAGMLHQLGGENGGRVRLTIVDPLTGYYKDGASDLVTGLKITPEIVRSNLAKLGVLKSQYKIVQEFSESTSAIESCSKKSYDYVLLDGDHSYEGVARDFRNYGPMINSGGLILFDDYDTQDWPDIKDFVDECVMDNAEWEFVGSEWRTAIFRKR